MTQALLQDEPHIATFKSILLFLGPVKMSEAAMVCRLAYKSTDEMLSKWQTAVMLSNSAVALTPDSKDLSFRLRGVFRRVKGEWLRAIYVAMGRDKNEAWALDINELVTAIIAHIVKASFSMSFC